MRPIHTRAMPGYLRGRLVTSQRHWPEADMKCSLNLAVNRRHLQAMVGPPPGTCKLCSHQGLPCPQRVTMSLAVYVGLMWVRIF